METALNLQITLGIIGILTIFSLSIYVLQNQPTVFWNNCGVRLSTTRKRDSKSKSLVKKVRGCLFKHYTDLELWQISAVKSRSLSKHPKTSNPASLCLATQVSEYTTQKYHFSEKQKSAAQHFLSQVSSKHLSHACVLGQVGPRSSASNVRSLIPISRPCGRPLLLDLLKF